MTSGVAATPTAERASQSATNTHPVTAEQEAAPEVAAVVDLGITAPDPLVPVVPFDDPVPLGPVLLRSVHWEQTETGPHGTVVGTFERPFLGGLVEIDVTAAGAPTGLVSISGDISIAGVELAAVEGRLEEWDGAADLPLPTVSLTEAQLLISPVDPTLVQTTPAETAQAAWSVLEDGTRVIDMSAVAELPSGLAALLQGDLSEIVSGPAQPLAPPIVEALSRISNSLVAGLSVYMDVANPALQGADAFVAGTNLLFAPDSYDPESEAGIGRIGLAVAAAANGLFGPVPDRLTDPDAADAVGSAAAAPPLPEEPESAMVPDVEPTTDEPQPSADAAAAPEDEAAPEGGPSPEQAGEAPAEAEIELLIPPAPAEPTPEQAEGIAAVGRRTGGAARSANALPSAGASTDSARDAVTVPDAETLGRAEESLAAALDERPQPSPEIVELCRGMKEAIESHRPVDEDELLDADLREPARTAGESLNESVQAEGDAVRDDYDAVNDAPQPEAPRPPQPVPPQAESIGSPDLAATEAAPREIPPEDLSLANDRAELDRRVEESEIHRPTTEVIPDGPFAEVREGQAGFEELERTRPAEVAAQQQEAIGQAQEQMQTLQLQALEALNRSRAGTVRDVDDRQGGMVQTEQQTRESLSAEARSIFATAQTDVNALLAPLTTNAMRRWNTEVVSLTTQFRTSLDEVKDWIDERHSGLGGAIVGVWDSVVGLPSWVTRSYDRAEREFTDGVCDVLLEISTEVNGVIAAAEAIIANARERIRTLFTENLPEGLESWAAEQLAGFESQLDDLSSEVQSARTSFLSEVSREAIGAVQTVQAEVEQLREEARGLIGQVIDAINEFIDDPITAIINGLLRVVGIPPASFWALVEKIQQVIEDIANDPMNFINNLMAAVKAGFEGFFARFDEHVIAGFWDWLFSGLGSEGVAMPEDTSVGSLVGFALELMGLNWPNIREILVRHIGEDNVALIEQAWELLSVLIERGIDGVLEMIQERLDPNVILQEILQAAVQYLIETLIVKVAVKLVSMLNPAGAIYQAVMLIYDILKWIFNNAARIFRFVETIVNGIADIIAGNISGMARAVEAALGSLVPVVIDFLAQLLGLGGLPGAVADVVRSLREVVLTAVDLAIGFLVQQARALLSALGLGGDEDEDTPDEDEDVDDTQLGTEVRFSAAGEAHRHWIDVSGGDAVLMVASVPTPLEEKIADWESRVDEVVPEHREQVPSLLDSLRALHAETDDASDAIAAAYEALGPDPEEAPPSDDPIEAKQRAIGRVLDRLYTIYGEQSDLSERFRDDVMRAHSGAQPDIRAGLETLSETNQAFETWEEVKTALKRTGRIGQSLEKPATLGVGGFSQTGHELAVAAIGEVIAQDGSWPIPKGGDPAPWLNPRKRNIKDGATGDYGQIVSALHDTIWTGSDPVPSLRTAFENIFNQSDDPDADLVEKVNQNGIIEFLKGVANGAFDPDLTAAEFPTLWGVPANKAFLKDRFRGVASGNHEWIPTNLIPQVVQRASETPTDVLDWDNWVKMHHVMRTDTTWVIFHPNWATSTALIQNESKVALTGHAGALYYPRNGVRTPLQTSQNAWHDDLRVAFNDLSSPEAVLTRMQDIARSTVWTGRTNGPVTYDSPYLQAREGASEFTISQLAANQRPRFLALIRQFDQWKTEVGL